MARLTVLLVLAVLLVPRPATAQDDSIEVGIDGRFQIAFYQEEDNITSFSLPVRWIRVGFPISTRLRLEPVVSFEYSSSDFGSATVTQIFPYLLYNFRDSARTSPYVRAGAGLAYANIGSEATTRLGIGAGIGTRMAMTERLSFRLEAGFNRWSETDDALGLTTLQVLAGLSFFP